MTTKIGDPEAIRGLARMLVEYCEQTRDSLHRLRGQLTEMQSSMQWADDNHAMFCDEFDQAANQLHQVLSSFEQDQANRLVSLAAQYDDVRW